MIQLCLGVSYDTVVASRRVSYDTVVSRRMSYGTVVLSGRVFYDTVVSGRVSYDTVVSWSVSYDTIGVKTDQTLFMQEQICSVCRACFLKLRRLASIRPYLSERTSARLNAALIITSRLDCCNSVC